MDANTQKAVKSIVRKMHISGQWPLNQLFTIFDALTEFDGGIEKKRSRIKIVTSLAFFFAVMCMVGSFVALNTPEFFEYMQPLLVFGIAGFVAGFIGAVLMVLYARKDLQHEYRTYLQPLLKHLEDDLKPGNPVAVDLHLSPIKRKAFSKGKGPKYKKGAYYKCYDRTYERTLLTLKLRLRDGNRLMLVVNELYVESSRTKRNPRGKYKLKYKYKKRLTFDIRALVNPEKFSCGPVLAPQGDTRFYDKERNNIPIAGARFKDALTWKLDLANKELPPLKPSKTLKQLMTLYARVQPRTSAPEQPA